MNWVEEAVKGSMRSYSLDPVHVCASVPPEALAGELYRQAHDRIYKKHMHWIHNVHPKLRNLDHQFRSGHIQGTLRNYTCR